MKIVIQIKDQYGINNILSQIPEFNEIKNEENIEIEIVYTCGNFLKGEVFAVLVAYVRYLEALKKQVRIIYNPDEDCETIRYAARINFFRLLGIEFDEKFDRHDAVGRFIEITPFEGEKLWDIVHEVTKIFKNALDIDNAILDSIYHCFGEVVCNVDTHSQSTNGGIIYAQYLSNINTLKIFIIDSGIGFYQSLTSSKPYQQLTHEQVLSKCLEKEVTNGKGKGMGLYHTSLFTIENKGILKINSCGKELSKTSMSESIKDVPYWQGSIISMEIRTNEKVNYDEIFEGHEPLTFDDLEESRNEAKASENENKIEKLW